MAYVSNLTCIFSALILHNDEVTITEDKINTLIKAATVIIESFWPDMFAKSLADINTGKLSSVIGTGGPAPVADAPPAGGPAPSSTIAPDKEKKVEAQKED
ncbi:60S acidic ribosomal protein P1-like isoform X1 [Choloepus didactylus]|uniref:60S acidic ribosomal protein P1-like isoform X1 n=1 Tax=Choloepus didactylus TaxID=27675 RepID=UPI0018A10BA8|nr:60S acidic ribosomal protein P1-like isoform X1 [Choloepus didactylus]